MENSELLKKWRKFASDYKDFLDYLKETGPVLMKEYRSSNYFTQKQASEALGVTINYISQIETGVSPLTLPMFEKMMKGDK